MGDLKKPGLMYLKAALFLLGIILSGGLLLFETPNWRTAVLVCLLIWCSARAYYFAFYVIEKYIDKDYKFAGLCSFISYLLKRKK